MIEIFLLMLYKKKKYLLSNICKVHTNSLNLGPWSFHISFWAIVEGCFLISSLFRIENYDIW